MCQEIYLALLIKKCWSVNNSTVFFQRWKISKNLKKKYIIFGAENMNILTWCNDTPSCLHFLHSFWIHVGSLSLSAILLNFICTRFMAMAQIFLNFLCTDQCSATSVFTKLWPKISCINLWCLSGKELNPPLLSSTSGIWFLTSERVASKH